MVPVLRHFLEESTMTSYSPSLSVHHFYYKERVHLIDVIIAVFLWLLMRKVHRFYILDEVTQNKGYFADFFCWLNYWHFLWMGILDPLSWAYFNEVSPAAGPNLTIQNQSQPPRDWYYVWTNPSEMLIGARSTILCQKGHPFGYPINICKSMI